MLAELGQLWVSCDGMVTFRRFTAGYEESRSTDVQAHLGVDADELGYMDIVIANDDELLRNSVSAEASGGTVQTVSDASSITDYGTRSHNVASMWREDDAAAADWAEHVLYVHKDYESRIDAVTLPPLRDDSYWPVVLGCEFGDLMLVTRRPSNADAQDKYVFLGKRDCVPTAP